MQPRRSVLYMPGANQRAMQKARDLDCDTVIFDLEDAVSPSAKSTARALVAQVLLEGGYGHRELVVRCNGLDTPWGEEDVQTLAASPCRALLFPKIERIEQVEQIVDLLQRAGGQDKAVWLMVETPAGVLDLATFCHHEKVEVLVMGTSDLVKELRASHTERRQNIAYALQRCVLVARRFELDILDGVHLDFRNSASFETACEDGRAIGFDGKTLIHPTQIDVANRVFGYSTEQIEHAKRILEVWQEAIAQGRGVAVLDDKLVENLHAAEAERVMSFANALTTRES